MVPRSMSTKVRVGVILSDDHLSVQIAGFRYEDKGPEKDHRLSTDFDLLPDSDLDWKSGPLNANLVSNLTGMLMEYLPDLAYHQQREMERKAQLN